MVSICPENVVADIMHVFRARIWHLSKYSELREKCRFKVSVYFGHHLQSQCIFFDCIFDLSKSGAIIVVHMQHEVYIRVDCIEIEIRIYIWPGKWFAEKTLELGTCTIDSALLPACLCINFLRIIRLRQ
jgi:hypothetical protein